ncbi:type IV toxin-antitoxin system AbiEi family antitoxin domain-containing protein [Rhizobium aegyptiacum]|uniref:type IV toxin-antitoxin system AbiEi family antitoxin domain-containing protein n=2 Tax=Rhizobium TaxID=379 RepID=UPI0009EF2B54|nr:type IV toxin-antitoxin system AbiEi family antitoxin domain-containing protein [Rhizobium aegyptiacum]
MPLLSVMNEQKRKKLKSVIEKVPAGFLVDSAWMRKMEIRRSSTHDYVRRSWLEPVIHGVYRRPSTREGAAEKITDWRIAVLSAQTIMDYKFHVGGRTALALQGHVHYLALGAAENIFVYGNAPRWLISLPTNGLVIARSTRLFDTADLGVEPLPTEADQILNLQRWAIQASTPERAVLETLDELPENESFHNIDAIFEGLSNLRPRRLTELLAACTKVQVKRLFFVFADRHKHAWLKHVDRSAVDLGSGDRSFVKGGKLHPIYRITIPEEYLPRQTEGANGP